jgi:hypothetical protein
MGVKMRYKYAPAMQIPLGWWIKEVAKTLYFQVPDLFVKPARTESGPVFVAGCGHSGTTLLATILSRHRDFFAIGHESEVFLPVNGLFFARKAVLSWDQLARQFGKKYFVEKTPKHALCLKRIFKVVPDARVLFIVRDGRDNVASLRKRFGDFDLALWRWISDNGAALLWKDDPRVLIIRYEDLVREPADAAQRICGFLGIDFEDPMLSSTDSPYDHLSDRNMAVRAEQVREPIRDNSGRWKEELSAGEVEAFWKKAGTMMRSFGYED